MTRSAKRDAPTISLDRPVPLLRAASPRQSERAEGAVAAAAIDNALVAELESALQAVLTRAPEAHAAGPSLGEPPPQGAVPRQAEGADDGPDVVDTGATETGRQPAVLLRPAQATEPAGALSWEIGAPADADRAAGDAPRRHRMAPRATLCAAGLLAVAAIGGAALMLAAPGDPPAVTTAQSALPQDAAAGGGAVATIEEVPAIGQEAAASAEPSTPAVPAGAVRDEAPGSGVTLLRPVGQARNAAAAAEPAERLSFGLGEPAAPSAAAPATKAPDRLVEAPATYGPAWIEGQPGRDEPVGLAGREVDESRVPVTAPAAQPAPGSTARLPSEPSPAAGEEMVAAVPTPLAAGELVARTGPADDEASSEAAAPGAADAADRPEAPQTAALEASGADADAAAEPTRSAPVTSAVNMRAAPANDAAVITVVPAGSEVGVIGCDFWCEVVFAGERGWIYKDFLGGGES